MRFRELPGFPSLFVDYVEDGGPAREFFPHRPDAGTLCSRAALTQDPILPRQELCEVLSKQAELFGSGGPALSNIARLRAEGSVVIATTLRPGLFGGPLSSWLKAMTAARLATWLTERGLPAIPVVWIESSLEPADLTVGLLPQKGPERAGLNGFCDSTTGLPDSIHELLARVEAQVDFGTGETNLSRSLESAYRPGIAPIVAWGRAVSGMLESCGLVLLDPSHSSLRDPAFDPSALPHTAKWAALQTEQRTRLKAAGYDAPADRLLRRGDGDQPEPHEAMVSAPFLFKTILLPVVAFVIEESEVFAAAIEQTIFAEARRTTPIFWPRVSATLVDERSRKLLTRYGLDVRELYEGPQSVAEDIMKSLSQPDPLLRIAAMKAAVEAKMAELAGLVAAEDKASKAVETTRRRMVYQLDKLAAGFTSARQRRRQIIAKHAEYLCGHVAPWGALQERELAGFQFVLADPVALTQKMYEVIDPWKFEHQLVFL